jgi:hypothetical protein
MIVSASNSPRMHDLTMDLMERWRRIGGSTFVTGPLVYAPDGKCSLPNNCGTYGLMNAPGDVTSPRLLGFKSFIAGNASSSLPFTSADVLAPPTAVCTPSCQWGVCVPANSGGSGATTVAGKCLCFAGVSGASCDTFGPKLSDCAAPSTYAVAMTTTIRVIWRCCYAHVPAFVAAGWLHLRKHR